MQYETYVFEEKAKSDKSYRFHYVMILIFLATNIFSFVYLGAGIGIIGSIAFIIVAVKYSQEEKNKVGLKAHGRRVGELVLTKDFMIVKGTNIPFDQVRNLII